MSHTSRTMTILENGEKNDKSHRPRSRNRHRMVVERTEVKQGNDAQGDGFIQVEVSMSMETLLDENAISPYRSPITIQYSPGSKLARAAQYISDDECCNRDERSQCESYRSKAEINEAFEETTNESFREIHRNYETIEYIKKRSIAERTKIFQKSEEIETKKSRAFDTKRTRRSEPVYSIQSVASRRPQQIPTRTSQEPGVTTFIQLPIDRSTVVKKSPALPSVSTLTTETTITTTTEITSIAEKNDSQIPPALPTSPIPILIAPSQQTVREMTERYEVKDVREQPSGNAWRPKGGPKPADIVELKPARTNAEYVPTATGGKYKKVEYEFVDNVDSTGEDKMFKVSQKREPFVPEQKQYRSTAAKSENVSTSEYARGRGYRTKMEISNGVNRIYQEIDEPKQEALQRSGITIQELVEESKVTEIWSKTSKPSWPDRFDVQPTVPVPCEHGLVSETDVKRATDSQSTESTEPVRVPEVKPVGNISSATLVLKDSNVTSNIRASESWDSSKKASYSTASTLEKTHGFDRITSKEIDRMPTAQWTVVRSSRHEDDSSRKKLAEVVQTDKSDERRDDTEIILVGIESSSKSTQKKSANMSKREVTAPLPANLATPSIPSKVATTDTKPSSQEQLSSKQTTKSSTTETGFKPKSMDHYSLPDYHSTISARPGFQRTNGSTHTSSNFSTMASGGRILKTVTEFGSSTMHSGGLLSPFGQSAAFAIRDAREREKKEMSDLNDRLASYIEKVRFLEAQNRKLAADLDLLRGRWGKDTVSVRSMYEGELQEARKVLRDTTGEREDLERQIQKISEDLAEYRRRYDAALHGHQIDREAIDELLGKLSALETEINLLRRRVANLEEEVSRIKRENLHSANELSRARTDLDQETLNRIDFQNQVQTLLEEIDFMRRVQDQEITELQTLASRDTTPENREYFKSELTSAIRDIRAEYDQVCNVNRTDMESWYKLKVQEIQTQSTRKNLEQGYAKEEVKRLRVQLSELRGKLADLEGRNSLLEKQTEELNYQLEDDQRSYEAALDDRDAQIRKMREECQALMLELQMLLDTKQTLDAEIAIFRKMLEGEENRAGLRQLVEQVVKTHGLAQVDEIDTLRVLKGETASRTSFQRSAKGNVSIQDASLDGRFIVVENTHRSKEEFIGEWKIKRKIDGKREIVFTFPQDLTLRPGNIVKIWAHGQGGIHSPPNQLIFDSEDTFGTGSNIQTILFNKEGEERATHIQRSSQTIT